MRPWRDDDLLAYLEGEHRGAFRDAMFAYTCGGGTDEAAAIKGMVRLWRILIDSPSLETKWRGSVVRDVAKALLEEGSPSGAEPGAGTQYVCPVVTFLDADTLKELRRLAGQPG